MICFDTTPLIWGVQGVADDTQPHMVARTQVFINHLADKGIKIMVPVPVMIEYLSGFSGDELEVQRKTISTVTVMPEGAGARVTI